MSQQFDEKLKDQNEEIKEKIEGPAKEPIITPT